LAPANDIRLLKVVIFSRAATSLVTYFGETTGLFKPIDERNEERVLTVEYGLSVLACTFLIFCFIFHPKSMPASLHRTIARGMGMSSGEKRLFDSLAAMHEMEPKIG